jgi:hypothetical protein
MRRNRLPLPFGIRKRSTAMGALAAAVPFRRKEQERILTDNSRFDYNLQKFGCSKSRDGGVYSIARERRLDPRKGNRIPESSSTGFAQVETISTHHKGE